jgi:succinyl-diaminopimelate desuccinylase
MTLPLDPAADRETVDLLRRLVQTCSYNPPGEELEVARLLGRQAEAWGLRAELTPLGPRRANLLVSTPVEADGPLLLFCAHLDTVPPGDQPWEHGPLSADLADGVLHGRGAVDMKGGLAAMLAAMRALGPAAARLRGRVRLVGLVGEEVDCAGAKSFLAGGGMRGVAWMVVGEPSSLDVITAHRGALWLEVTAHGRTAHGSMPHLGLNAIDHLIDLLREIRGLRFDYRPHPLLAPPTLNLGTVVGGIKTNVVPDLARATLDLRTLPGQRHDDLVDAILSLGAETSQEALGLRIEVNIIHDLPPVETPTEAPLVRAMVGVAGQVRGGAVAVKGAPYYTDAAILTPPTGVPTIIFGPGDETLCHQPNERVEVEQVLLATRCYADLAERLLGATQPPG